jgi:hypothetical protein
MSDFLPSICSAAVFWGIVPKGGSTKPWLVARPVNDSGIMMIAVFLCNSI